MMRANLNTARAQGTLGIRKIEAANCTREDLVALLEYTVSKMEEKNIRLRSASVKLRALRVRISKLKDIVKYQRDKILQLYRVSPVRSLKASAAMKVARR